MPVDGTYVVEGEYLVTVERLSTTEVRKQRNVPTIERTGRKPLRSISPSSSDENNVSPKEPKQKNSFIKKLRNSFKSKEKRVIAPKEESADIATEHSDENIPIQDLSRSLGGSKVDNNDTADEAEELDIDNTDQPISQTKYTLGTSSNADPVLLHVEASEGKPLLAENTGDMDLDELIKTLDNATFDIPPKSLSKSRTGSSTSTTTTPSLCKGSEAGEVVLDLQLSMHSCSSSTKNSLPSVQGCPEFPHCVSGNSDIPLPVEYQKLDNEEEYPDHEYQVLGERGDVHYEVMDSSKSSQQTGSKAEFPNSAKKLISVDVIMFPSVDNGDPSEISESLHYEKVVGNELMSILYMGWDFRFRSHV